VHENANDEGDRRRAAKRRRTENGQKRLRGLRRGERWPRRYFRPVEFYRARSRARACSFTEPTAIPDVGHRAGCVVVVRFAAVQTFGRPRGSKPVIVRRAACPLPSSPPKPPPRARVTMFSSRQQTIIKKKNDRRVGGHDECVINRRPSEIPGRALNLCDAPRGTHENVRPRTTE